MTALDERLRAFFAARDAAVRDVLSYGASPPEYPGLALVPVASLERLRAVWKPTRDALDRIAAEPKPESP